MKNELQRLMKKYRAAAKKADAIDAAWEEDYENEQLEAAWTAAYKAEYKAFDELADCLVRFSLGRLNKETAMALLRARLDDVEALIARLA